MPRLVLFDCDGVLVDSEALVAHVEARLLTAAGFPVSSAEVVARYVGLAEPDMLAAVAADHGRPVPPDLVVALRTAAAHALATDLVPVVGIVDVLASLTHPRCVASGSSPERLALSLEVTGLARFFPVDAVFSASMVRRGKPAPDLFLHAADRMGADPADCMVVEDSPRGVAAAVAAGMTAVGLTAASHATPSLADRLLAAGAAHVCATTAELTTLLDT